MSLSWELWASLGKTQSFSPYVAVRHIEIALLKTRSIKSLQLCALFWICSPDPSGGSQTSGGAGGDLCSHCRDKQPLFPGGRGCCEELQAGQRVQ